MSGPPAPPAATPGQAMRDELINRWTARGHCVDGRSWDLLPQVDRDDLEAAAQAAITAAPGDLVTLTGALADLAIARRELAEARAVVREMLPVVAEYADSEQDNNLIAQWQQRALEGGDHA